ncbi:MAG TPA: hypothetical protein VGB78_01505 [Thermoplasmata archaeon]
MAIRCEKCRYVIDGQKGLHTVSECPNCHQKDPALFTRVEADDGNPAKSEEDRKWLEAHRV